MKNYNIDEFYFRSYRNDKMTNNFFIEKYIEKDIEKDEIP